ncbi:MAG: ABC transporter ATP-binding protein [Thermodesulfobacteriota bacterium]|nr:ABC transporter ATP-binding protein [Thermodesulfobacteriota bacterium]
MRRVTALEDLNLNIMKGETFGYLGSNGAGKTTTMKLIMGLIFPTKGKVCIWGKEPSTKEVKRKIGFLPENPYFYDYLKVRELLQFYGRLFGLENRVLKRRIIILLERLGLEKEAETPLRQLSKGNIQRLGIAQALINDPELLVLDEPMSGLDPMGRRDLRDLILELKSEGKTILFSTHILPDVETICDRVGILVKGKARKVGPLRELLKPRVIAYEVTATGLDKEVMEFLQGIAIRFIGDKSRDITMEVDEENISEVLDILHQRGARLLYLVPKKETLEEVFLKEVIKEDENNTGNSTTVLS